MAFKSKYNIEDYVGQTFGRLEVKEEVFVVKEGASCRTRYFLCKCSCGKEKLILPQCLISKNTRSCGCLEQESRGKTQRKTLEKFIEESTFRFPNKFTYDKTIYKNSKTKVTITCILHGDISVNPENHLKSNGCPLCSFDAASARNMDTVETFILKANKVFEGRYDYSKTQYSGTKKPVNIVCKTHGEFSVTASCHLLGSGCPSCRKESRGYSTEDFVNKAVGVYGDLYSYQNTVYTGFKNTVKITCREHGDFERQAAAFIQGHGCRLCASEKAQSGFRTDKPASLYLLEMVGCDIGVVTGFGITTDPYRRIKEHNKTLNKHAIKITKECYFNFEYGWQAQDIEVALKRTLIPSAKLSSVNGFKRESTDLLFKDVLLIIDRLLKTKDDFIYGTRFEQSCGQD